MLRLLTLTAALLGTALPACSEERPNASGRSPAATAKRPAGLEAGDPQLAQAMHMVLERCRVSAVGHVSGCAQGELHDLQQAEQRAGHVAALLTFCHGLGESSALARGLSAARLNRMSYYRSLARAQDPELLACLLGALPRIKQPELMRPVARAAAYLATAMGREKALLPLLNGKAHGPARAAGYGALWANGRLRLLPALRRQILSGAAPAEVRRAALNGFRIGPAFTAAERSAVCPMVAPLLGAPTLSVASAAAQLAAERCPPLARAVLLEVERRNERHSLDPVFISALRTVDANATAANAEWRPRVLKLVQQVARDAAHGNATRAAALRKVAWIDRSLSIRLARELEPEADGALRDTVNWVLQGRRTR